MQVDVLATTVDGQVQVRCACGAFTTSWHGALPEVGSRHRIELDVDGAAIWHHHVVLQDAPTRRLVNDGRELLISGLVIEFGPDEVLVVDVDGTPVTIDTDGAAPPDVVGRHVTVRAGNVTLYPCTRTSVRYATHACLSNG